MDNYQTFVTALTIVVTISTYIPSCDVAILHFDVKPP